MVFRNSFKGSTANQPKPRESQTRRFRMVRYFTLTSLGMLVPVALALTYFLVQQGNFFLRHTQEDGEYYKKVQEDLAKQQDAAARRDLLAVHQAGTVNLAHLLENALWEKDFAPFVATAQEIPVAACRAMADVKDEKSGAMKPTSEKQACFSELGKKFMRTPGFADLNAKVYAAMRQSTVFKIKVFDLRGITLYSSEHSQIGEDKASNAGWIMAAREGKPASELTYRDKFSAFEGVVEKRDLISIYLPVLQPGSKQIVGVFEAYSDVTPLLEQIKKTSADIKKSSAANMAIAEQANVAMQAEMKKWGNQALTIVLVLMLVLFGALYMLVRRADAIITKQENEGEKAGEALRGSEAILSVTINTALDAVVQIDAAGIIVRWNTQAEEIFGWPRVEAIGRMMHETIIPPQYREAHIRGMKHFLATGEGPVLNKRIEIVALHRNGHEFPIELSITPLKIADKHEFNAFIRDITERKQAQDEILRLNASLEERVQQRTKELEESEMMSRSLTENMAEGVITTTPEDIVLEANTAALQLFGYEKSDLIGRDVSELVPERHRRQYKDTTAALAAQPEGFRIPDREIRCLRKDGSEFLVSMSFADVQVGGRRLFTALVHDITARKQAQDEILRLNASLEERVQQRTEELEEKNKKNQQLQALSEELQSQQEELRQTNEELEEKNKLLAEQKVEVEHKSREIEVAKLKLEEKAEQLTLTSKYKSEFLSSMSHELRTPLNSLLILAQLLAENPEHNLSGQQIEYAKIIQGAGKDLLELINDILDLSKIESGTVTPDLQDVTFANVREQLERTFHHVAEKRGLGFSVELAPGLPPSLTTDSQRLQQVMKNLLSNAFKFTQKGQVSVRIAPVESGWRVDHDGLNRARTVIGLFVTDSGIGLAADKQKIIFEAFQQADTGTARKYGGTGLGLSISREIARLLGGELRLAMSEPGKGSTFVLYLPLRAPESGQGRTSFTPFTPDATQRTPAAQEGAADANPQPPAVADDRAAIKPGDRTLLIIEDDARFADILLRAARDKGFKGIVAARGDDGLKLAGEFKPTAITLDLHLPDMDGWVVLERLKRNPDTRHIPVEIISAEDNRPRGLRYGAFEYLVKPVTAESLQKALADVNKFAEREVKDLLVADGDEQHRNNMLDLIGGGDVRIEAVASGKDALAALKKKRYDCIVLDLNLPDIPVADLLEAIQGLDLTRDVPVIIYGIAELPQQEQERLQSLALKGIVKEVRTPERLLDETALFLHRVVSKLPEERRQMLEKLYLSTDSLAGKKVLVVDDDVRNIFALTAVLERHKMAVLTAENGRDAIDALGKNPDVDIVLMDIMMPEMDGYEAMRQIRQMKQFESLPMIALTAKAMKGDREQCIEAGASDYLSKPVDTDQLVSLLRVWLYR